MSIRFYIAPQQGTGTFNDPFRSILNDFINPANGESFQELDNPARRISVCCMTATDATHATIGGDSRIIVASRLYSDLSSAKIGLQESLDNLPGIIALKTKLETIGINTAWISASNNLRDGIRYIFRVFVIAQIANGLGGDANIKTLIIQNLDNTVGSLSAQVRNGVKNWMQSRGLAVGWITNSTTVREVVHFVVMNLGLGILKMMDEDF